MRELKAVSVSFKPVTSGGFMVFSFNRNVLIFFDLRFICIQNNPGHSLMQMQLPNKLNFNKIFCLL